MPDVDLTDEDGSRATIAPERGGVLRRFARPTRQGIVDVLQDPPGSPVMFPIAGFSHADGQPDRYRWDGEVRPMPIHGFAMRLPWRQVERDRSSVRLELGPGEATGAAYPFAFRLVLSYALDRGCLRTALEVENVGDRPMPFSTGFHPYVRLPLTSAGRRERCVVRLPACREYVARPEGIVAEPGRTPRKLAATAPAAPARHFADLETLHADLVDELSGLRVSLDATLDSSFRCLTAWSPQADAPFYCIEPRSALQDAFSYGGLQLTVLAPGATFAAGMTLALHDDAGR